MADLSNPTPLHRLCAYNRQADLGRRDGVDGILSEFRAAEARGDRAKEAVLGGRRVAPAARWSVVR
jgi:hypothetical protein